MKAIIRIIYKNKLHSRLFGLILVSVLSVFTTMLTAHMISSYIEGTSDERYTAGFLFILFFFAVYIISVVFNLLTEYTSQSLTAKIAGLTGKEYIDKINLYPGDSKDTHDLQYQYSSTLTTQLERFRAEYVLPLVSIVSRGIILLISALYFLYLYSVYALLVFAVISVVVVIYYFLLSLILKKVDSGITSSLTGLGVIVQRVTKSFTFLYYSRFVTALSSSFSEQYDRYGKYRGLNGMVSLAPRYIIETVIIIAVFYQGVTGAINMESYDLVFLAFVIIRLNPHAQIFIKNISTIKMSLSSLDISAISKEIVKYGDGDLPVFDGRGLLWEPKQKPWLQLKGPSGSGKTTLAFQIANFYKTKGYSIAFIESNPALPFKNIGEINNRFHSFSEFMRELGVSVSGDVDVSRFSNGERQRILIVLSILNQDNIIIIDEGLSALGEKHLSDVFHILQESRIPVVFVSHQISVNGFCDKNLIKEVNLDKTSFIT